MRRSFKWAFDDKKENEIALLKSVPLFNSLDKTVLRKLLTDLFKKDYAAGDIVFSEGDMGKALYVVMDGLVKIVKNTPEGDKTLAVLKPGSYFGELALIKESPRFASAVTEEKTKLLIMYKSYFDNLIRGDSAISSRILLNLVESLSSYICVNQDIDMGAPRE